MAHLRSSGADVWWQATGRGSPVLLINGLSSPSATWFRLTPILAAHHTVLTFDNPGTGRTTTTDPNFTMTTMSDAAAAVIRTADLGPAHVLGLSMGGLVGQDLALGHPDLVASLTLVSTHAGAPHMTQDPATLDALAAAAQLLPEERTRLLARMAFAEATPQERIAEDLTVRAAHPTTPQGYAAQLAATSTWERLTELGRIACPTLILHGAADSMVSPENARMLLNHIPGARLVLLEGCGHSVFTDQPEQASRAVVDFLATLTPTDS